MRSAIFLGLIYVAKAIKEDFANEKALETASFIVVVFFVMDVAECIKYLSKTK